RRSAIDGIRVYAFRGGKAAPIPFQIDERDERNRWMVRRGARVLKPDETPGRLDDNDVLVLMNRDRGEKADPAGLPDGASSWVELRVGPEGSPLGFAYVGSFAEPPARSEVDYCHYDEKTDRVRAETYDVTFGAPLPTRLRFANREGNALRAMRAHGEARFFGGLFTLRRTERDIRAEIEGSVDGPVRVVRPARYEIALPLGFRATARINLLFYRDFVVGQATAKVKIPPRLVPADGELVAYFEFADESGGRLLLERGDVGESIDGTMSPEERRLVGTAARWAALRLRDDRTFLVAVRPEGSLKKLDQRLYFHDGAAKPSFGFELAGVSRLETGEHDLFVNVMLLESTAAEEIRRAATILASPPEVHAEVLEPRGTAASPK
ncbi:MAG: hypothetical protein ACREQ9_04080, partial [Candidatus Binatia bacterium]